MDVSEDQLKRAVEGRCGGTAIFVDAIPATEIFSGQTVWDGTVHI